MIMKYKLKIIIKKLLYFFYRFQYQLRKFFFWNNLNNDYDESKINLVYKNKPYNLSTQLKSFGEYDVSFIVPVYNAEKYIRKCIDSILRQNTDKKFEVICVNDGSIDGSNIILKEYDKYNNVTIIYQQNSGVSAARNAGILVSKGKYICFVDSDDQISSNFLSLLLKQIEENDSDIVKGNYSIKLNGKIVLEKPLSDENYLFDGFCWGTLFKRELWNFIRFPEDYWYEDMIIRMLLFRMTTKIAFLEKDIYTKNERTDSEGKRQIGRKKNTNFKCLDHIFLIEKILNILSELNKKNDEHLISLLRDELGGLMYGRIIGLPSDIRHEAFNFVCNLYVNNTEKMSDKYVSTSELHDILLNRNYNAWVYFCKAQRIKY